MGLNIKIAGEISDYQSTISLQQNTWFQSAA